MELLALLIGTFLFCWALRKQFRHSPWVFYCLAFLLDILMLANKMLTLPLWLIGIISPLMQKGGLGIAFFSLVMWIGVFPRTGTLSKTWRPIRAELSITACILIAGHMALYLSSYLPRFTSGAFIKPAVVAAFAIACILLALILILGITSLKTVKRHMNAKTWKQLQTLAYPFYALVLAHLLLMIGPSAARGSVDSIVSIAIYLIVFGGYIVARIWRAILDKREAIDIVETVQDQGFKK